MKLIEKFKKKVLNSQNSFVIDHSEKNINKTCYFVQGVVGKAQYVYGCCNYNDNKFYSDIDLELKLVAIIRDNKIYIWDEYFFTGWWDKYELQLLENVFLLEEIVKRANGYVKNVVFSEFYLKLEIPGDVAVNVELCQAKARRIIFSGKDKADVPECGNLFIQQDIANMLCGFIDFDKEVIKKLEMKKNQWMQKKAVNTKIQELIEKQGTVLPWEKEIADRLLAAGAKMVTAEFESEDKKATAKICPDIIINKMITGDSFSYWDFSTGKSGMELFKELGIDNRLKECLTCRNINKIMYRGNILYTKVY